MAKNVDFSICRFIKENMWIYTYNDFCDNRKIIKKLFNELSEDGKLFYMWYLYSNINMNEYFKDAIWSYLNEYDPNGFELLRIKRFYNPKKK